MKNIISTKTIIRALWCVALLFVVGCRDFVQNIEAPIDSINDDQLDQVSELPFLINGVKVQYASAISQISVLSGGLSDELEFSLDIRGATFPTYDELESGQVNLNNTSVDNALVAVGQLRILADTLITRVARLDSLNRFVASDSTLKNQALFTGYFYGGIARFLFGAYFGLEPTRGGMALYGGPFLSSDTMFQRAVERFKTADKYCANTEYRLNQAFLCKTLLIAGRYKEAYDVAGNTLIDADKPFQLKYSTELANFWYNNAGKGRMQWALASRFQGYTDKEINDTNRIKFETVNGLSGTKRWLRQLLYPTISAPMTVMSWQECYLMYAELILRVAPSRYQDAQDNFNFVRDSRFLPNATDINLDSIYVERDKELNCTGNRLLDQRRFKRWHLPAGTWQYLPITVSERSRNPNLK
jgi:hypothetical protein